MWLQRKRATINRVRKVSQQRHMVDQHVSLKAGLQNVQASIIFQYKDFSVIKRGEEKYIARKMRSSRASRQTERERERFSFAETFFSIPGQREAKARCDAPLPRKRAHFRSTVLRKLWTEISRGRVKITLRFSRGILI